MSRMLRLDMGILLGYFVISGALAGVVETDWLIPPGALGTMLISYSKVLQWRAMSP